MSPVRIHPDPAYRMFVNQMHPEQFQNPGIEVFGSDMKNEIPHPGNPCGAWPAYPCCYCVGHGYPWGTWYPPVNFHYPQNQFHCFDKSPGFPFAQLPHPTCNCKRDSLGDYHRYSYPDFFHNQCNREEMNEGQSFGDKRDHVPCDPHENLEKKRSDNASRKPKLEKREESSRNSHIWYPMNGDTWREFPFPISWLPSRVAKSPERPRSVESQKDELSEAQRKKATSNVRSINVKDNKKQGDSIAVLARNNSSKPKLQEIPLADAATRIQSVYRGYNVRRWGTLKKLKQLAQIREELDGIQKQIEELDSAVANKERLYMGEMIMNLLLKLDAVQGLHPSFRDLRKLLARQLTSLQEKLDSSYSSKNLIDAEHVQKLEEPKELIDESSSLNAGYHSFETGEEPKYVISVNEEANHIDKNHNDRDCGNDCAIGHGSSTDNSDENLVHCNRTCEIGVPILLLTAESFNPTETNPNSVDSEKILQPCAEAMEKQSNDHSVVVPQSPAADYKLSEENKQMREMMQKLMDAGEEHLKTISNLLGRVSSLENRLSIRRKKQRRLRMGTRAFGTTKHYNHELQTL